MQKCKLFLTVLTTSLILTNSLKGMDANSTPSTSSTTPTSAAAAATASASNSSSVLSSNTQNLDLCDTIQIRLNDDVSNNPLVVHFIRNNLSKEFADKIIAECTDEDLKEKISTLKDFMHCTDERKKDLLDKVRLKGLILVGPPGTGKSTLAAAIALHCGIPFLFASAPGISTEYKNSGPQNLHRIFREVERVRGGLPTVIIFDEIMGMISNDKKQKESDPGISQQFQTLYDQIERGDSNIILIGTANNLEKLPDPIKDRFSGCIFDVPLPDFAKRKEALTYQLFNSKKFLHNITCTDELIKQYASKTSGMSLRNICRVANEAVEKCLKREKNEPYNISDEDLFVSLANVQKSINNKQSFLKKFEKNQTLILGVVGSIVGVIGIYFAWKSLAQAGKIADNNMGMGLLGMTQSLSSHDEQMLLNIVQSLHSLNYQKWRDMVHNFIQLVCEDYDIVGIASSLHIPYLAQRQFGSKKPFIYLALKYLIDPETTRKNIDKILEEKDGIKNLYDTAVTLGRSIGTGAVIGSLTGEVASGIVTGVLVALDEYSNIQKEQVNRRNDLFRRLAEYKQMACVAANLSEQEMRDFAGFISSVGSDNNHKDNLSRSDQEALKIFNQVKRLLKSSPAGTQLNTNTEMLLKTGSTMHQLVTNHVLLNGESSSNNVQDLYASILFKTIRFVRFLMASNNKPLMTLPLHCVWSIMQQSFQIGAVHNSALPVYSLAPVMAQTAKAAVQNVDSCTLF